MRYLRRHIYIVSITVWRQSTSFSNCGNEYKGGKWNNKKEWLHFDPLLWKSKLLYLWSYESYFLNILRSPSFYRASTRPRFFFPCRRFNFANNFVASSIAFYNYELESRPDIACFSKIRWNVILIPWRTVIKFSSVRSMAYNNTYHNDCLLQNSPIKYLHLPAIMFQIIAYSLWIVNFIF